jgi:hypothetical protein
MSGRTLPALETLQHRLQKSTTFIKVAQVAQILALQELREVRSCRLPSQPLGLPFLKMMPPFMLCNLNKERRVPLATEQPDYEPQQALLNAKRVFANPSI